MSRTASGTFVIDLHQYQDEDPRIEMLNDAAIDADGECVLLWVSRAKRTRGNPARNLAIEIANDLGVPVIAVFALVDDYPDATLRAYHFLAEGLDELAGAFRAQHIGWVLDRGSPGDVIPKRARKHNAAVVVTDMDPLRPGRAWRRDVASSLRVPLAQVDADTVVPASLFDTQEYAPRTIRPKMQQQYDRFIVQETERRVSNHSGLHEGSTAMDAIATLSLNRDIGPAPDLHGGEQEALKRLTQFVDERLTRYDKDRSRADITAGSQLSPWLHYGFIGGLQMATMVRRADAPAAARDSFLDELIVQREIAINFALRNPDYDSYAGLPEWARDSLAKHAKDPRPEQYTRGELESAQTDEPLWNAAQRQLVREGWMPNRLRMYWAKQILRWSPSPERAWLNAISLNNAYFVDGRDANSFANVGWSIGGLHDRPFGPERAITGIVRPMGLGAMKRTFDIRAYIDQIDARWPVEPTGHNQQRLLD